MTSRLRQAAIHSAVRPSRLVRDQDVRLARAADRRADRGDRGCKAGHLRRLQGRDRCGRSQRRRPEFSSTSSSAPPSCEMPRRTAFTTACPAEKSGQEEFDFQYGEDFAAHIEAFHPTFCKVLVRYNPEGEKALNERQAARLKRLSDYLKSKGRSRFMFELLVPPEKAQLDRLKGDKKAYDLELRPRLMVEAIEELQDAKRGTGHVEDRGARPSRRLREDCRSRQARGPGQGQLHHSGPRRGRQEGARVVGDRVVSVPGFIGFAVGRTTSGSRWSDWRAGKLTREAGGGRDCAGRYREFVGIFERGTTARDAMNMRSVKLAPSILAADFGQLGDQVAGSGKGGGRPHPRRRHGRPFRAQHFHGSADRAVAAKGHDAAVGDAPDDHRSGLVPRGVRRGGVGFLSGSLGGQQQPAPHRAAHQSLGQARRSRYQPGDARVRAGGDSCRRLTRYWS